VILLSYGCVRIVKNTYFITYFTLNICYSPPLFTVRVAFQCLRVLLFDCLTFRKCDGCAEINISSLFIAPNKKVNI